MGKEAFDPDKQDVLAIAIKYNGNITAMAEHFKIARNTIYDYLKRDPQGKEIIEYVRGYNTDVDLDGAEWVYRYNLKNYKEEPAVAQRAAEKVLASKGHLRGWGPDTQAPPAYLNDEVNTLRHSKMLLEARLLQAEQKLAELGINVQNEPETEFELPGSDTPI